MYYFFFFKIISIRVFTIIVLRFRIHLDEFLNDIFLNVLARRYILAIKETFKALSDDSRREILEMLKSGKMNAGDISAKFDMTQATISHHLSILKEADLIRVTREGKFLYYELNTTVFNELMKWILDFKEV